MSIGKTQTAKSTWVQRTEPPPLSLVLRTVPLHVSAVVLPLWQQLRGERFVWAHGFRGFHSQSAPFYRLKGAREHARRYRFYPQQEQLAQSPFPEPCPSSPGESKAPERFHKQATSGSSQWRGKKNSLLPSSEVQGKENIFQKLSSPAPTLRFPRSHFILFVCLFYVPQAGFKLTL